MTLFIKTLRRLYEISDAYVMALSFLIFGQLSSEMEKYSVIIRKYKRREL